ncbi:DNA mismatch repair protein MutS [Leptobacterium flavescens]|uniref:DNA mismatch repair protein MutS n=1 Tax=Leptobacterium flavescens TaxID=472055 RepID=A0A6P0UQU1_9FLAO|nr:DNA mismatch repair protein MutS [Leptobacterium flavescens]NER12776.1 DNA mismatch repair protein MutS [Leptobacterium flavescens]
MKRPFEFYTAQKELYKEKLTKTKKRLAGLSVLRILVFVATIAGVYFSFDQAKLPLIIGVAGIGLFLFLVSKYTDIQYEKNKLKELVSLNKRELKIKKDNFGFIEDGEEFSDPVHAYSNDVDLFGPGSFFQYLNRTVTNSGKEELARLLASNEIKDIDKKQEAIKELEQMPEWGQEFRATAALARTETPVPVILKWLKEYTPIIPGYMKTFAVIFSIISAGIISLAALSLVPEGVVIFWLVAGVFVVGRYLKKISHLSQQTSKVQDTFQQYHRLLMQIEKTSFTSDLLKEKYNEIHSDSKKASEIVRDFSKALDAFDQRNNIFFIIPANGFFLWDIFQVRRMEKWIVNYKDRVEKWFEVIAFFDAQISLANFAFNHPDYTYPKLNTNGNTQIKRLGHPLVDEEKLVRNNFEMETGQFFVITGANMAGKSTFLRTVSLHHIMANTGLPVCAEVSEYAPTKLITSMRTSDSLSDDESYFFSELKRLKFIVEKIQKETYFIVLDEILKGTNSKDKATGSRRFLEKLTESNSTGIIATHDLSLCKVAEAYTGVENYYFDAYIQNDELSFDYKFKEGICQNMNASFLLEKMGIV